MVSTRLKNKKNIPHKQRTKNTIKTKPTTMDKKKCPKNKKQNNSSVKFYTAP